MNFLFRNYIEIKLSAGAFEEKVDFNILTALFRQEKKPAGRNNYSGAYVDKKGYIYCLQSVMASG